MQIFTSVYGAVPSPKYRHCVNIICAYQCVPKLQISGKFQASFSNTARWRRAQTQLARAP